MPRDSDDVTLDLLLGLAGKPPLKDRLEEWRYQRRPRLRYKDITDLINAEVKEIADRLGRRTRTYNQTTIQRWAHEYGIE